MGLPKDVVLVIGLAAASGGEALWAQSGFECAGFIQNTSDSRAAKPAGTGDLASRGTLHVLTIFAGFSDEAVSHPRAPAFATNLFEPEHPGSFSHFYDTMSFGLLEIRGTVLPDRYGALHQAHAYVNTNMERRGGYGSFVTEVLEQVDREMDFGQFDNEGPDGIANSGDDDGVVDYVFVVTRSTPAGFVIGRATGIAGLGFPKDFETGDRTPDGRSIWVSSAAGHGSLVEQGNSAQTVGAMAHEFGHALGLPDLYDLSYDTPEEDSAGIGRWGLMGWGAHGWTGADGPVTFCAWSLEQLGWSGRGNERLVELFEPRQEMEIRDLFRGGNIYKIFLPANWGMVSRPRSDERKLEIEPGYLLLEQRTRDALYYHRNQPGEGLLVWYVRPEKRDNNWEECKRVDLICADGLRAGGKADPLAGGDDLDFWAHDEPYALAHLGNKGDATDPFDGVRRTAFDSDTNPSTLSVGDFSSRAVTGLSLRMRRQGEAMQVDVEPPRWSGLIDGEAHWTGVVLVDGDVEVAPQGRLLLYRGAEILFAAGDRSKGGLHPQQSELRVHGGLQVVTPSGRGQDPVVFRGRTPDAVWYGIVVDPDEAGEIDVPGGSLVLQDASRGIALSGAPFGASGLQLQDYYLLDRDKGEEAGNSDGLLQPGESVRPVLELANWSLSPYEDVEAEVRWNSSLLRPTWGMDSEQWGREVQTFSAYPGQGRRLEMPVLTLHPDTPPGQQVVLRLFLRAGKQTWEERLELEVQEVAPLPAVELTVAGWAGADGLALLSADELRGESAVSVQAAARGGTASRMELVIYSHARGAVLEELEMHPVDRDGTVFETRLRTAEIADELELAPRVTTAEGGVFFGTSRRQVEVVVEKWRPVLAFGNGLQGFMDGRPFGQVLGAWGIEANFFDAGSAEQFGEALFEHYLGTGKAIIALSRGRGEGLSAALARYLERGGNLLVFSRTFHWTIGEALREKLYLDEIGTTSSRELRSPEGIAGLQLEARHEALTVRGPAEPLLVDDQGNVSGFRLDSGTYRVVYLPFNLSAVDEPETAQRLLGESLDFLRQPRVEGQPVIRDVLGVGSLGLLEPIYPRLLVDNPGPGPSGPFQAVYQVLREGRLVEEFRVDEEPLGAGQVRTVDLPSWSPLEEADFTLRFALRAGEEIGPTVAKKVQLVRLEGHFETISEVADGQGNGAASFDYDGDGDLDFYLVRLGAVNLLYRNDRGAFSEVGQQAGLADPGQGRGLALGDYDGDGDLDLYLVNQIDPETGGANRLYRNEGEGRFVDVTAQLDLLSGGGAPLADEGAGRSAGFLDYDEDGDLDLYVLNALDRNRGANRLFRNDLGRFAEVATEMGLDGEDDSRGMAIGDYDRDGDPDLYVANRYGRHGSQLLLNEVSGGRGFVAATTEMGLRPADMEVAAVFGDYDDDGDLDLFVTNESGANVLWRNEGRNTSPASQPLDGLHFVEATADGGLDLGGKTVGAAFLDYDNDGDLDLATTGFAVDDGGDELYHNRGAAGFVPVGEQLGLRRASDGRGIAPGDYDADGRQDLLVADVEQTTLYRNVLAPGLWLQVILHGEGFNANGLGARVEVNADGHRQVRELQSSYGYGSQIQPWFHFGLGTADQVDSLRVFWPDGAQSLQTAIGVSQRLVLTHPQFTTAVEEERGMAPQVLELGRNFPNPFNVRTVIPFAVPTAGRVRLDIFDVAGQQVRTLIDEELPSGQYRPVWDGRSDAGQQVGSGVYIYRLRVGRYVVSRRLLLLK